MTNITEQKLKKIVRESVREALKAELMKLRAFNMSEVSQAEQKDIEKRFKKPSRLVAEMQKLSHGAV